MAKFVSAIIVGLVSALLVVETTQKPIVLTLFYESLCPYSRAFVKDQLYPTWKELTELYLSIDFVPYGNAETTKANGTYTFACQHGDDECYGNKIHACALKEFSDYYRLQVEYISCSMSSDDPPYAGPDCAKSLNVNDTAIEACAASDEGSELLQAYGVDTDSFTPEVNYVPFIALNGVHTEDENNKAVSDLKSLLCQKLNNEPVACKA